MCIFLGLGNRASRSRPRCGFPEATEDTSSAEGRPPYRKDERPRAPAVPRPEGVVWCVNAAGPQNGHIRKDTREVGRTTRRNGVNGWREGSKPCVLAANLYKFFYCGYVAREGERIDM